MVSPAAVAHLPQPVSARRVDPDPSVVAALGRHHTLPTAVADLVDNAVDAGAGNVLVRFLLANGRAAALQVIDDGHGMDAAALDDAMTYARQRTYTDSDLGHFGIGLKAASLSQARSLVVWSRRTGDVPVGRRLRRETLESGPLVEAYSDNAARRALQRTKAGFRASTVVEWHHIDSFLHATNSIEQTVWLEDTVARLGTHLGLVLHRILARGALTVTIDQYEDGFAGAPRQVQPVDPFGYTARILGFPVDLVASVPEGNVPLRAHLWPVAERRSARFHTGAGDGAGLYVYRRDRLQQAGGWNGLAHGSDLELARIELDLDEDVERHATINPEKSGVVLDHTFAQAILNAAAADGTTFADVLARARHDAREARRKHPQPIAVVRPRFGVPPSVRTAYDEATESVVGEAPFDIRWRNLPLDRFYEIDRGERIVKINARYRSAIVGGTPGRRKNDAALVKTLLHLLLADHLTSTKDGARMKRETAAWQELLVAAVLDQQTDLDGRTEQGA